MVGIFDDPRVCEAAHPLGFADRIAPRLALEKQRVRVLDRPFVDQEIAVLAQWKVVDGDARDLPSLLLEPTAQPRLVEVGHGAVAAVAAASAGIGSARDTRL